MKFRKISVKIKYAEKVSGVTDRIRRYTTVTRVEYGLINGLRGLLNSSS